jgi:uncharacterized protein YjiK
MTARAIAAVALATCVAATACRQSDGGKSMRQTDSALLTKREARLEKSLAHRDTTTSGGDVEPKAVARWIMPRELDELSGLALTPDGRLFGQGDERGEVFQIDFRRGVVLKQFLVGHPPIKADLEAITYARNSLFMLASNGTIYEFREGSNGQHVDYTTHDTKLGKECEFEGLAFDSVANSLLLACKNIGIKHLRDELVLYRWKLDDPPDRVTQLTMPLNKVLAAIGEKKFQPSDITIDPFTGNYLIISGIEKAMIEITPELQLVFARKIPGDHEQPESVAITRDSILIIGDEAKRRPAVITLYPWP